MAKFAPGMRVIIRDEEWMIKKCDSNSFGSYTLQCVGISPLVKDKPAYEFDRGDKTKDFPMFTDDSQYTDDIIMSIVLSLMLLLSPLVRNLALLKDYIATSVVKYCSLRKKFPLWGIT